MYGRNLYGNINIHVGINDSKELTKGNPLEAIVVDTHNNPLGLLIVLQLFSNHPPDRSKKIADKT